VVVVLKGVTTSATHVENLATYREIVVVEVVDIQEEVAQGHVQEIDAGDLVPGQEADLETGAKGEEFPVQGHDQDRDQDQLTQDTQDHDPQNKRDHHPDHDHAPSRDHAPSQDHAPSRTTLPDHDQEATPITVEKMEIEKEQISSRFSRVCCKSYIQVSWTIYPTMYR